MRYIASLIVVEDIKRARLLYEGILGQKVQMDHGESLEQTALRLHTAHMPIDEISRTTSLTKEAIE